MVPTPGLLFCRCKGVDFALYVPKHSIKARLPVLPQPPQLAGAGQTGGVNQGTKGEG